MVGSFYCISFYGIIYFIVSKWCYMLNEDSTKNRNKGKEILFSKCNFFASMEQIWAWGLSLIGNNHLKGQNWTLQTRELYDPSLVLE